MQQMTLDFSQQQGKPAKTSGGEPKVLSVSEVNRAVKATLESGFSILWIKGEISNFKPHTSGHWYFGLKDAKAQISAVMFRGFNQTLRFKPEDGMEVLVRGKITVYEPRGNYQVFCEVMEPVGAGAQQLAFEQLKAKLQAEGLFAKERKRALPAFPKHVVVVTSPTGAAIRDILNVLGRRFRGLRVTLVPAVVQGEQAPASILAALQLANRLHDVDVMIIGRGGGSAEDLWCFNDERVVRAIAACRVPTISAVGHEIDFTIADFVADVRAPTPSAAAEIVVQSASELSERLALKFRQLQQMTLHRLEIARRQLRTSQQRLVDPKRRLADLAQRCDELQGRLTASTSRHLTMLLKALQFLRHKLGSPLENIERLRQRLGAAEIRIEAHAELLMEKQRARLAQAAAMLDGLSPLKVLDRGYAIATKDAQVVRDAAKLKAGDELDVRVAKGLIKTVIKSIHPQSGV